MASLVSESKVLTTDRDAGLAQQFLGRIGADRADLSVSAGGAGQVPLPAEPESILKAVLETVARSGSVTVSAIPEELTTVSAAALIGVSRPTLMEMIKQGRLPAHKVGSHTRLRSVDVLAFLRREREEQEAAFEKLRTLLDE